MKIVNAKQKNFEVDKFYYTERDLKALIDDGLITNFSWEGSDEDGMPRYHVFARDCSEIEIICSDGYYVPVVITKKGPIIHVTL